MPQFSVRFARPLPDGSPLPAYEFDTAETAVRITRSITGGCDAATVGYTVRRGGRLVPAYLPQRVAVDVPRANVAIYAGARLIWEGRRKSPKYFMGEVRGVEAKGYYATLDDGLFESSETVTRTSGEVIQAAIQQVCQYNDEQIFAFGNADQYQDPGVAHALAEFTRATPGQIVDQILREGGTDGWPWDLQIWPGQRAGEPTIWLRSRAEPDTVDYQVNWDETVDLATDDDWFRSSVRVAYQSSDAGGADTRTDWTDEPTGFGDTYGFASAVELQGGTLSRVAAERFRDTYAAYHAIPQWSGTITRTGAGLELFGGGTRDPWDVRPGEWVRVAGGPKLLIMSTDWTSEGAGSLSLKVGPAVVLQADLFRNWRDTLNSVKTKRNPITGGPQ